MSPALVTLQGRVELVLSLLARALGRCRCEPELVLPLGRVAMQTMPLEGGSGGGGGGGEGLALLQLQAVALAAALFRRYPAQRGALMGDFLAHVVGQLGASGGRAPPRPVVAGGGAAVQVASAAVARMVQASVDLPAVDAAPDAARACYGAAAAWAGAFWDGVFDLLPAARAAKSDTAQDTRAAVEALLADLLALQCLPEWPAANVLLRLFAKTLSGPKGLQHADSGVKALCVDFTGLLVRGLCGEALAAEREAAWVDELAALVEAERARQRSKRRATSDTDGGPGGAAAAADDDDDLAGAAGRRAATLQRVLLESMGAWGARPGADEGGDGGDDDDDAGVASARRFLACQMLHDALLAAASSLDADGGRKRRASGAGAAASVADLPPEKVSALLVAHRSMLDERGGSGGTGLLAAAASAAGGGAPLALGAAQAAKLARRLVVDGPLGAGRATMLGWLVEAGDRQRQDANAAQVRAKAIKCVGAAAEVDARVLGVPEVQRGVAAALQDDGVSVREAAVELLARHIIADPALAEDYFDALAEASQDQGVSVRKRAVRTLWECCERCPGFSRRVDAVVAILQRVADSEESMRTLVTKICGELWFAPGDGAQPAAAAAAAGGTPTGGGGAPAGAAQRAEELARAALAVYEAGGRAIHVPLAGDHPLVAVIASALAAARDDAPSGRGSGGHKGGGAVRRGAVEVADALLDQIVQLQGVAGDDGDGSGADGGARFSRLLALHALAAADPALIVPHRDPQRFVRTLAPYAAPLDADARRGPDAQRRAAEEALCLLAVLQAGAAQLRALAAPVAAQLTRDLAALTSKHMFTQVVASAAACLCGLSRLDASVAPLVGAMARKMVDVVEAALGRPAAGSAGTPQDAAAARRVQQQAVLQLPRVVFLLGQLCRHGADLLDATSAAEAAAGAAAPAPSSARCLELFMRVWREKRLGAKALDMALQAMGLLFIARPELILSEAGGAADVYREALRGGPALRARVLSNMTELLRCDEDALLTNQRAAEAAAAAAAAPSTLPAQPRGRLQKRNGEGDGGHLSSGLLQDLWTDLLALAVDTAAAPAIGGGGAGGTPGALGASPTPSPGGPSPLRTPGSAAGAGAAAGGAPPEAAAAATRRRALELIEVVLRGGHVAPWTAVAPLVALCADPAPDTRGRALRVLRQTHDKYPDFVAERLAPAGVAEAWRLHRRLWDAAHPGVPPPAAPRPEALQGLGDVYAQLVQGDARLKARFLAKLLAPFADVAAAAAVAAPAGGVGGGGAGAGGSALAARRRSALGDADAAAGTPVQQTPLARAGSAGGGAGGGAAGPDFSLLAFCAHTAAALPMRRADEPLLLVHHIDAALRRHAGGTLERLRAAALRAGLRGKLLAAGKGALDDDDLRLDDDAEGGAAAAAAANGHGGGGGGGAQRTPGQQQQPQLPPRGELLAAVRAAHAVAALLVLKQFVMAAYWLDDARVAAFAPKGDRKRAEEKAAAARNAKVPAFGLAVLNPQAVDDATGDLVAALFVTLKGLMDQDATMRALAAGDDGALGADGDGDAEAGAAADGDGDGSAGAVSPGGGGDTATTAGDTPSGAPRARGASAAADTPASVGTGRAHGGGGKPGGRGLVVFASESRKPPRGGGSSRGKGGVRGGRGSAGGGRGSAGARGRGRGRGAGRGRKRRRSGYGSSDDDDDDDGGAGGDSSDGDDGAEEMSTDDGEAPAKQLF